MLVAAIKRYYNDDKAIPPATTSSNGDFNALLLYRFNIDESDIVVIYKIMSLSDIALVLISLDNDNDNDNDNEISLFGPKFIQHY